MSAVISFINIAINPIIGIGFITVLVFTTLCSIKMKKIKEDADSSYRQTKYSTGINRGQGSIVESTNMSLDLESIDRLHDEFNAEAAKYVSWVQTISVFPLLGLLGTVSGLIPGLQGLNTNDMTVLYSSMNTALFSTFFGIIAAIILKVYTNFGPSKHATEIESYFEETDRRLNEMATFNKLNEAE